MSFVLIGHMSYNVPMLYILVAIDCAIQHIDSQLDREVNENMTLKSIFFLM